MLVLLVNQTYGETERTNPNEQYLDNTSLRAQTAVCGVVAPCYQYGNVDSKVPQLYATQFEL